MFDVITFDEALAAHSHISQMKSCHCVFGWAIRLYILGKECVALALRSESSRKLSLGHSRNSSFCVNVLSSFHLGMCNLKLVVISRLID